MELININQAEKYSRGYEIYLAELCAKVRYNQILIDKNENRVSSKRFLAWLDDKQTSKRLRPGLLSLYEKTKNRPFHRWCLESFCTISGNKLYPRTDAESPVPSTEEDTRIIQSQLRGFQVARNGDTAFRFKNA